MPDVRAVVQVNGPDGWVFVGNVALDEAWTTRLQAMVPPPEVFTRADALRFPTLPTTMARQLWKAMHPGEPAPWHDGITAELPGLLLTLVELEQFPWDVERTPQLAGLVLPWMRELAQSYGADHVRLVIVVEPEKEAHAD